MSRHALQLIVAAASLTSAAHYKDWVPGSCDLSGAEDYLADVGIGPGLPKLEVRYGHFATAEHFVHGADTTFAKGSDYLSEQPRVRWEQTGKYTEAKYAVLVLDADGGSGPLRPRMLWLVLNAQKLASSGHTMFTYEAPRPSSGRHRCIVILFQQVKPGNVADFMRNRGAWDLGGFMDANRESLRPVSYNFFYVDADLKPEDEHMALGLGEDEDDFPEGYAAPKM
jgi:hypothetical protein